MPQAILQGLIDKQKGCPLPNKPKATQQNNELIIDHYECCHKPLPEYSNIETLSMVHHALGFLPEPSFKQVLLVEVSSDDPPGLEFNLNEDITQWDRAVHCLKVIHGELFLLCNIHLRSEFINYNRRAFKEASFIEVPDPSSLTTAEHKPKAETNNGPKGGGVLSFDSDFRTVVEGLTLPMNEEQLYRH